MRILFVSAPLLFPANTGGRIRSSQILRRLHRQHRVTVLCFRTPGDTEGALDEMRACCERLETVPWSDTPKFTPRFYAGLAASVPSRLPYTVWKYASAAMRRCIAAEAGKHNLLICDFLQPAVNLPRELPVPWVLFQHNVEAAIVERHARHARNPLARAYLRLECRKLERFERHAVRWAAHTIAVSEADRDLMASRYGVSSVSVVPTGVDSDHWAPAGEPDALDIVFTGSMDWIPNQDAVTWFTWEILPRIRRDLPVSFVVVGRNPPPAIRGLAQPATGITVTGTVDDVRPYVERAAVVVVPLRIGGGTRIKIFEAMSMARCVVSTAVGAEGLPVEPGRHLLVADNPADFAAAVVSLLRDPARRRSMGAAARDLVTSRFTWDVAASRFAAICENVAASGAQTRTACV